GRLAIAGAMIDTTLTLTGAGTVLANFTAKTVTGSQIRAAGDIAKIVVGALIDSNIFAGVNSSLTSLPDSQSDFVTSNAILSLNVTGKQLPFSFSNSNIAAATIGKVVVSRVNSSNGGTPFGIAGINL